MFKPRLVAALFAGLLVLAPAAVRAADGASFDDTAKFLAGMQPSADSPLARYTREGNWKSHAQAMNRAFAVFEKSQLAPIREWVKANLTSPQSTMLYMFSGPDFLYANAFFPNARTYVLAALEPVGPIPDVEQLHRRGGLPGLGNLQRSMRTLLSISFFITKDMKEDLSGNALRGTIPILYVFLARSGKKIIDVKLVDLDKDGESIADDAKKAKSSAHGVKIVYTSDAGPEQTLYYFSTDISNGNVRRSGFLKFLDKLGPADSLVKSASYLLHNGGFSQIREYLTIKSATVVQDDSGIPLRYFDKDKWAFHPYGRYLTPLSIFPGTHQTNLEELYRKNAKPLPFGYGYRWRPRESNVLVAVKNEEALKADAALTNASETLSTKADPAPVFRESSKKEDAPQSAGFLGVLFGTPAQKNKKSGRGLQSENYDPAAKPAYPYPSSRR